MTHYDTLEVSPSASPEVIKAAYRSLVQRFHPDRNPGDVIAARRTQSVTEAFRVLSDPLGRAAYDVELAQQQELRRTEEEIQRRQSEEFRAQREWADARLREVEEQKRRKWADARRRQAEEQTRRNQQATDELAARAEKVRAASAEQARRQQAPPPVVRSPIPAGGREATKRSGWGANFFSLMIIAGLVIRGLINGFGHESAATTNTAATTAPTQNTVGAPPESQQPSTVTQAAGARASTLTSAPQWVAPNAPRYSQPLSSGDETTIDMACSQYQIGGNVQGYQACMRQQQAIAANTQPSPDLSQLDSGVYLTISMACSEYQMNGDLTAYRACIQSEYAKAQTGGKPPPARGPQCVEITWRGKTYKRCD